MDYYIVSLERDAIIAHGAVFTLRDRLFEQSDKYYQIPICSHCGIFMHNYNKCNLCDIDNTKVYIDLPSGSKALVHYLQAFNIFFKY